MISETFSELFLGVGMPAVAPMKLFWVILGVLVFVLVRIRFLGITLQRLLGNGFSVPNENGWVIPSRQAFMNRKSYLKHAAPGDIPDETHVLIRPYTDRELTEAAIFIKQPASVTKIQQARRVITISAMIYQFPIPKVLFLFDMRTMGIYQSYHDRLRPVVVNARKLVEMLNEDFVNNITPKNREYLQRCVDITPWCVEVAIQLLRDVAFDRPQLFTYFSHWVRQGTLTSCTDDEIKDMVTAYSAFTGVAIPNEYVAYTSRAWFIYSRLGTVNIKFIEREQTT